MYLSHSPLYKKFFPSCDMSFFDFYCARLTWFFPIFHLFCPFTSHFLFSLFFLFLSPFFPFLLHFPPFFFSPFHNFSQNNTSLYPTGGGGGVCSNIYVEPWLESSCCRKAETRLLRQDSQHSQNSCVRTARTALARTDRTAVTGQPRNRQLRT
jgi:hypothetical protein